MSYTPATEPCGVSWCDVYDMTPWKAQCSYEGTGKCGAEAEYAARDITARLENRLFWSDADEAIKEIQLLRKIASDWKQTAEILATELGKVEYAAVVHEDVSSGLYDKVRKRMHEKGI